LKRSDQIKIGITGGIGSGKTTVSRVIESTGYPVYYSDVRAKELMNENSVIRNGLISLFGNEICRSNGLNRKELADKIFSDEELRNKVNELVHPIVRNDFADWADKQDSHIVFNEAAILFETGAYQRMNQNMLITSPLELRILRVMERDNASRHEVEARILAQMSDNDKIKLADYVVLNDEVHPVIKQIEKILNTIRELS
jgi:dephospho-CoA kinase